MHFEESHIHSLRVGAWIRSCAYYLLSMLNNAMQETPNAKANPTFSPRHQNSQVSLS